MAYRKHQLQMRIEIAPRDAAEEVARAFQDARCSRKVAAEKLGVSANTFLRWVALLDAALATKANPKPFSARLEKIKRAALREGWHHEDNRRGGRPASA